MNFPVKRLFYEVQIPYIKIDVKFARRFRDQFYTLLVSKYRIKYKNIFKH